MHKFYTGELRLRMELERSFLWAYRIGNDNVAFDEGNFGIELNLRAVAA